MIIWTLSLFLLSTSSEADWVVKETGIHNVLLANSVAVNGAGETFLLDSKEKRIHKLDAQGQFLFYFGRKGRGPGEMMHPRSIDILADSLYVYESTRKTMLVFDFEGNYKGQQLFSERFQYLAKTKGGWVGLIKHHFGEKAGQIRLKWLDDTLSQEKILVDYIPDKTADSRLKNPLRSYRKNDKTFATPFDPAHINIHYKVVGEGSKIIATYPGTSQQLAIFDGATGEILKVIEKRGEPIPFNDSWGKQQYEAHLERSKRSEKARTRKMPFKQESFYDAPDFFPNIRKLWAFEDDRFYILPWTKDADFFAPVLGFDLEGKPIEHPLDSLTLLRVVHLTKTHGWVFLFDKEEEEAGIARVPLENLASFVKTIYPATPNSRSPSP